LTTFRQTGRDGQEHKPRGRTVKMSMAKAGSGNGNGNGGDKGKRGASDRS